MNNYIEAIAAINGVQNNRIQCTVRSMARGTDIEGILCKIETPNQWILGRIGRVNLWNQMHSDPAFQPLVMVKGQLAFFSGHADIEQAEIEIITCIDKQTNRLAPKRSNPPSGTDVYRISPEDMDMFIPEKTTMMRIGYLPNDSLVPMSVICKHYGDDKDGTGWAEAKHRGYFGRSGSGKTVQALTHLAGRLVSYPQVGCLIPDTAGDISLIDSHSKSTYHFSFLELLDRGGRIPQVLEISSIRMEARRTLEDLFVRFLVDMRLGDPDHLATLANRVITGSFDKTVNIDSVSLENLLIRAAHEAPSCWATGGKQKADEINRRAQEPYTAERYEKLVRKFFTGHASISKVIRDVLEEGQIVLLKMYGLSQEEQEFVMYELFNSIKWQAEAVYNRKGATVNTEIVLDEAPRWVPQSSKERIPKLIMDAVRTTRKWGLSWTFIGQRLAGVDKEVIAQLHTKWFGRGLGTGADADNMTEHLGKTGMEMYETLNMEGGYFWLGVGDEVNLGAGARYVAVMSYGGDATNTIIQQNPHIWR